GGACAAGTVESHGSKTKISPQVKNLLVRGFLVITIWEPSKSRGGMGSAKFTNSAPSGTARGGRSNKSETIATWRTNRKLKIVGATRLPNGPIHALPEVDQEITPRLPPRAILRHEAHAQALRGRSTEYEFRLSHQLFRVLLRPRVDRRGRILGVLGTLSILAPREAKPPDGDLQELAPLTRNRREMAVESAIRSLELAKTVADTARVNAELWRDRA